MNNKVYLAGPDVFFKNAKDHALGLKRVCVKYGLEGLFPLDAVVPHSSDPRTMAQRIYEANIRLIGEPAAVIANMTPFRGPSMDVGTAWEMGYAKGRGMPVIGYTDSSLNYKERVEALWADGLLGYDNHDVEDFQQADNLMVVCCANIFTTFDEAVQWIARRLLHTES